MVSAPIVTRWRGTTLPPRHIQQVEFELSPTTVFGGEENVLVARAVLRSDTAKYHITNVSSFLGVQTGDIVEAAIDVVAVDQRVLYVRSLHKEVRGIYEAWDTKPIDLSILNGFDVVFTCRVCGPNEGSMDSSIFHGLVRVSLAVI
jgi:hypothetical protein